MAPEGLSGELWALEAMGWRPAVGVCLRVPGAGAGARSAAPVWFSAGAGAVWVEVDPLFVESGAEVALVARRFGN